VGHSRQAGRQAASNHHSYGSTVQQRSRSPASPSRPPPLAALVLRAAASAVRLANAATMTNRFTSWSPCVCRSFSLYSEWYADITHLQFHLQASVHIPMHVVVNSQDTAGSLTCRGLKTTDDGASPSSCTGSASVPEARPPPPRPALSFARSHCNQHW
jgi:hypothetical protein